LTKNPKNSLFLYKKTPIFDPPDFLNKIQQTTQKMPDMTRNKTSLAPTLLPIEPCQVKQQICVEWISQKQLLKWTFTLNAL
jgi:hypothetical protein